MKEIKTHLADPVKIEKQAQAEKQLKLIGRIMPHRGHTIWEYNPATGEIKPAALESPVVDFNQAADGRPGSTKKLMVKPGCQYIAALNKKNALKKDTQMAYQLRRKAPPGPPSPGTRLEKILCEVMHKEKIRKNPTYKNKSNTQYFICQVDSKGQKIPGTEENLHI